MVVRLTAVCVCHTPVDGASLQHTVILLSLVHENKPLCEICSESFDRHVAQVTSLHSFYF